ncbi:hypothetical protein F3157_00790 [Virgibacillus dakarensis]|uniref:SPOR domain-containing protein n=1 Tax=Lentibacillus populi TaxID=1827502 RepID=A0A9W5X3L6_9BACI|nr:MULTISPECIES: SPOR domain-containing protein [Bacillaceae]MBT2215155.1 hypothetical protein [Virgibacillus dakarensis]MTW84207.1 hypothetical protein [Virgibacillus dakarensis]GGB28193.1 hypothetical protein GCM10011409_01950 [Lentibacillus populi]
MSKKKPIVIWMNGKKTKIGQDMTNEKRPFHDEQASALEDSEKNEQVPTFDRYHSLDDKYDHYGKAKKRTGNYKTIIISAVSAVLIGICLGIIMLHMFDGVGHEANSGMDNSGLADTSSVSNNTDDKSDQNGSSYSVEQLNAFVLQAGIFSSKENAAEWSGKFKNAGFPTVIWKRDGQFFLLAGIADTKEQADLFSAEFTDFEIYAKEWNTKKTEIKVTAKEHEWLQSFTDLWRDSVKKVGAGEALSADAWQKLVNGFPKKGEGIAPFHKQLTKSLQQMEEGNAVSGQVFLLEQWSQYEELILSK